jgi:hypothetical protein
MLTTRPSPTGGPDVYVNLSLTVVAEVPLGPVTVTSTVPVPAGTVAVMDVSEFTIGVTDVVPKFTAVAPVNAPPRMFTEYPPESAPVLCESPVTLMR